MLIKSRFTTRKQAFPSLFFHKRTHSKLYIYVRFVGAEIDSLFFCKKKVIKGDPE